MEASAVLLYDGECGFCDRTVQMVLKADKRHRFRFAPLQGDFGRTMMQKHGQDPNNLSTMALVLNAGEADERMLLRGKAASTVCSMLGSGWRVLGVLRFLPAWLLDFGYGLVARNRFKIAGRLEACRIPTAEERGRFL